MESLKALLKRTINDGAPLYNAGKQKECFDLYFAVSKYACMQEKLAASSLGQLLEVAVDQADPLGQAGNYGQGAWVLRHCFDVILEVNSDNKDRKYSIRFEKLDDNDADDDDISLGYNQDEAVHNITCAEKAEWLANVFVILQQSIQLSEFTIPSTEKDVHFFSATLVVEELMRLGLETSRKTAIDKAKLLFEASLLIPVQDDFDMKFDDGTTFYRFPSASEIQQKSDEYKGKVFMASTPDAVYAKALQTLVQEHTPLKVNTQSSSWKLLDNSHDVMSWSMEQVEASHLVEIAIRVETSVEIKDRVYNFKKYPLCFLGSEAVTIVANEVAQDRDHAKAMLNKLLLVGLIQHVTRDHELEDKKLFYRFRTLKELQTDLDSFIDLPISGPELVRYTALKQRFQVLSALNMTDILDTFFGCTHEKSGKACWDIVDLQVWRNNMKRWGFGRRDDQDDAMIDKLSPLLASIDPESWKAPSEDWWSPWGILAQIALFDQIPRSAFRGTLDAFKWDELAIKATKFAIDHGYFETAYASTLNNFLVLLPLEHSESWEDQKLGVTLLLQLLSHVAVQDDGLSDYEIVKRLEFSKRLTTAFLEHAQVIAKFKRYPHRNKAQGRSSTLEERIWLASDLVPRWAKSQQHTDVNDTAAASRKLLQLPVIPLKRFTKG